MVYNNVQMDVDFQTVSAFADSSQKKITDLQACLSQLFLCFSFYLLQQCFYGLTKIYYTNVSQAITREASAGALDIGNGGYRSIFGIRSYS